MNKLPFYELEYKKKRPERILKIANVFPFNGKIFFLKGYKGNYGR
jgi:hypothetical protein